MDNNPEECPVCLAEFDNTVQRPRTLPCGHTFCTLCINKLKEQDHVACPECRVIHTVPVGGQFPVCYTLEAVIRRLRDSEAVAASLPPSAKKGEGAHAADKKEVAGLSKEMMFILLEQEATVLAAITTCQEIQSQLDQYQTTLTGWSSQQQQLEDKLQGLIDQSKSARELVQQEKFHAAAKREEVKKGEQQLYDTLKNLQTVTTQQEADEAVNEASHCTNEAKQVVEECQENFPDTDTIIIIRRVQDASYATLKAIQTTQVSLEIHPSFTTKDFTSQSSPGSTIIDRLQGILTLSLTVEDLRSLTQPARSLLEDGRVFAVQQVEGQCRHARISLEAGQLYLHALKEHPSASIAATLQVSDITPPSPPCIVFLDLSWPGRMPQRVQVYLSHDTLQGRQFALLCTGQYGPSFASTRLFMVWDKGQPGEYVCGGDYESNDGKGGAALLPGLDKGQYWKSGQAGAVFALWGGDPARGAQFAVTTRNRQRGGEYSRVFGKVVQGMDTLVEAAQSSNIKDVTVVDCGMVLFR